MRRFFWVLVTLAMSIASARAQESSVGIGTVAAGYGGYFRPGDWVPVFVELENRPSAAAAANELEDFEGRLMVATQPLDGNEAIRFVRDVDIPANSSKRYIVYAKLPQTFSTSPELVVTLPNGRPEFTQPLNAQSIDHDKLLMVTVTDAANVALLPVRRAELNWMTRAIHDPEWLPDHWAGWDAADIVAFPQWPGSGMLPENVEALREWVRMGGTLVFLAGQNSGSYADALAREILPVVLEGSGRLVDEGDAGFRFTRELASSGNDETSFLLTTHVPKAGTETLLTVDGQPVICRQRLGNGQIVFFAVDLQSTNLSFENLLRPAWTAISPLPNLASTRHTFHEGVRGGVQTAVGGAARPPNQFLIILICIAYTLIVGPLNFGILAARKRLEWAWVTVPVIVFVFFFLVYGLGRLTKGNRDILREASLSVYTQGDRQGSHETLSAVFVPEAGTHQISPVGTRSAAGDTWRWHTMPDVMLDDFLAGGLAPFAGGAARVTGNSPVVGFLNNLQNVHISQWPMATYASPQFAIRGPEEMEGPLLSTVRWADRSLVGEITNVTGRDFQQSWVMLSGMAYKLGALPNGESTTVRILGPQFLAGVNSASSGPMQPLVAVVQSLRVGEPQNNTEANLSNAATVLENYLIPWRGSAVFDGTAAGVHFVGLRERPQAERTIATLAGDIVSRVELTVVELDVTPEIGSRFRVGSPIVTTRLLSTEGAAVGNSVRLSDGQGFLRLRRGAAYIAAELPFNGPGVMVDRVSIDVDGTVPQGHEMVLEILEHSPRPLWRPFRNGTPLFAANIVHPISGRFFLRIESKEASNPQGGFFTEDVTTVRDLGIRLDGRVVGD